MADNVTYVTTSHRANASIERITGYINRQDVTLHVTCDVLGQKR